MSDHSSDKAFVGSIPALYQTHLVPMIFQPYADDLAARLAARLKPGAQILEIAAGTGVVTRAMASALPSTISIVATDLNQDMLNQASTHGTSRPVVWRQADAMALPFDAGTFDAVVCQFGVMFFPDKAAAYAEVRRVLKPGGVFMFNVWDRTEDNDFADIATKTVEKVFPENPPGFLKRTPYAYFDPAKIKLDLSNGGFTAVPEIITLTARGRAESAQSAAVGYCQATPMRKEIEDRKTPSLEEVTGIMAEAVVQRSGHGSVDSKIQAVVVIVEV